MTAFPVRLVAIIWLVSQHFDGRASWLFMTSAWRVMQMLPETSEELEGLDNLQN